MEGEKTLEVTRWQPRGWGGRETVFWAHLGAVVVVVVAAIEDAFTQSSGALGFGVAVTVTPKLLTPCIVLYQYSCSFSFYIFFLPFF